MQKSVPGAHETAFKTPVGSGSGSGSHDGPLSWTTGIFDAAARHVVYVGHDSPLIDALAVGSMVWPVSQVGPAALAVPAAPSTRPAVPATINNRRISCPFR